MNTTMGGCSLATYTWGLNCTAWLTTNTPVHENNMYSLMFFYLKRGAIIAVCMISAVWNVVLYTTQPWS